MARIMLTRNKQEPPVYVDSNKCIICQKSTDQNLTSNEQGRKRILDASVIRNDVVAKRIKLLDNVECLSYHMSNQCYKKYTLKKTLEKLSKEPSSGESDKPAAVSHTTRSSSTSRPPPSSDVDIYRQIKKLIANFAYQNTIEQISCLKQQYTFRKAHIYEYVTFRMLKLSLVLICIPISSVVSHTSYSMIVHSRKSLVLASFSHQRKQAPFLLC